MKSSTTGVALIGTGFMGRCHAFAWRQAKAVFPDVAPPRLVALCDADPAAARESAARYGFARATADWREAVGDPEVSVVSITSPNALHREMAMAALAAGKHVWCEKPMAPTLDDAVAMAAAAATAGTVTQLGYNYVRNPAIGHAKRLLDAGRIGRLLHVRGVIDEDYGADDETPWSWRDRAADAGLGVLSDLMCHLISMTQTLVGPIQSVCADFDTAYRARPLLGRPGETGVVDTEDLAHALVRFADGATGSLASSRVAWGRKNRIGLELHGSRGMLIFEQERMNELALFAADGDPAERGFRTILTGPLHPPYEAFVPAPGHQLGFNDLKVIEAAELLRAIAGGPRPTLDFAAGLRIEAVVHGMARSARERSWLDV